MSNNNIYGQSTKESYRCDIEDSRKQKTLYKNYEYFDDYSYGNSDAMGLLINNNENGKKYVTFFQPEILKKLLEWRRSGESDEIGHKGGGNLRNIYGFYTEKVEIISKISDTKYLKCETNPNKLYDLSISDIDEQGFRNVSDSSAYIKTPEEIDPDYVPRWHDKIYKDIKDESGIEPNYLVRMEMTELPQEYVDKDLWTEYINQLSAKQYNIPIKYKNEILLMNTYQKIDNIDLIGFEDQNKINPKTFDLYINSNTNSFYFKEANKYVDVKTDEQIDNNENILLWGSIYTFIVSKDYLCERLKEYNENNINKLRQEDFYGIYFDINDKITNYLPIEGKPLGDSRNNNIDVEEGQKNNGRFRMIFKPNNTVCSQKKCFDALIRTETIKALSGFLDKSPYKDITKKAIDLFKGKSIIKSDKPKKLPKKIKIIKKKDGGIYVIYIGNGVYKFGCVKEYTNMDKRIQDHKRESIGKVKEFTGEILNYPNATVLLNHKTTLPEGCEEKIAQILINEKQINEDILSLYGNQNSRNDIREYFGCNSIDYITQVLIPLIKSEIE